MYSKRITSFLLILFVANTLGFALWTHPSMKKYKKLREEFKQANKLKEGNFNLKKSCFLYFKGMIIQIVADDLESMDDIDVSSIFSTFGDPVWKSLEQVRVMR